MQKKFRTLIIILKVFVLKVSNINTGQPANINFNPIYTFCFPYRTNCYKLCISIRQEREFIFQYLNETQCDQNYNVISLLILRGRYTSGDSVARQLNVGVTASGHCQSKQLSPRDRSNPIAHCIMPCHPCSGPIKYLFSSVG